MIVEMTLRANSRRHVSFDVDLPTEVDDEYWENEHESEQFKQPTGKPSTVSYFISLIKLIQILAIALRTIVSRAPTYVDILSPQVCRSIRLTNRRYSLGL